MRPDASQKLAAVAPKKGPSKALIGGLVALLLVLVAGGVYFFSMKKDDAPVATSLPKNAVAGGKGVEAYPGKAAANAKTVDMYVDFQCPICKEFEKKHGEELLKQAQEGKVKLNYHVMSFLDENLRNDASTRAANAAFCSANAGAFPKYVTTVFANQPANEGDGYTDDQLLQFGKTAGITAEKYTAFEKCVKDKSYTSYVKQTQEQSGRDGVTGTPSLKVNGKKVSEEDMGGLLGLPGAPAATLEQVLAKY